MGVLNTILLVLFVLSGILTVLLVLAHSGKGTGVSDMIDSPLELLANLRSHFELSAEKPRVSRHFCI